MRLVLGELVVLVGSGSLALLAGRRSRVALGLGAAGAVAAAALGLGPALGAVAGSAAVELTWRWAVPGGEVAVGLDPLTGFFLVPLLVLGAACAIYGSSYMRAYEGRRRLGPPAFFFNVTLAAMVLVLIARHALLFVVAWEVMTLASYVLVTFDHGEAEVRRAGWTYLIAGHVGVTFLLALFLSLGRQAGGLRFADFAAQPPASNAFVVVAFGLGLLGFGVKAGIVPLHVWLPEAHAAAPSHVSALMSGVLIKLGLYGILRTSSFLAAASWRGPLLVVLGLAGGLLGIALALYQRDIKRVLAYSSIENVGVILLGIGVGLWGVASGHATVAALGIYGGLLHLWNHAVMKGLMFLAAGNIAHGSGGRDLERMGGLLRRMPWTGLATIVGALAIAALPPLTGFVSEWLVYLGLLERGRGATSAPGLLAFLALAALATMGALGVLCFVRLVGVALLGQPRSEAAREAHEAGPVMLVPVLVLAAGAVALAFGAPALVPLFGSVAAEIAGGPLDASVAAAPLRSLAGLDAVLVVGLVALAAVLALLVRRRRSAGAAIGTWDCGYAAPTARMQYTAGSFSEIAGEQLLPPALRLRLSIERPRTPFPATGRLSSDASDPVTRSIYEPVIERWAGRFSRLRWLQQGALHAYLLYILAVVLLGLLWASARRWWWAP